MSGREKRALKKGLLDIVDALMSATDENGRLISALFQSLPTKRELPDYYRVIERPIALDGIRAKVEQEAYASVEAFMEDVGLMCDNARTYNAPRSQPWKDANTLRKLAEDRAAALGAAPAAGPAIILKLSNAARAEESPAADAPSPAPAPATPAAPRPRARPAGSSARPPASASPAMPAGPTAAPPVTPTPSTAQVHAGAADGLAVGLASLLAIVKKVTDDSGNPVFVYFAKLPTRKALPAYYDVIKTPIDLTTIEKKLEKGEYATVDELAAALNLMCDNARKFNEEGSAYYAAATSIKKAVAKEIKRQQQTPVKMTLTLPPAPERTPASKTGRLIDAVKALKADDGSSLSDPFVRLPTRKALPAYYELITDPIDLATIEKKLANGEYATPNELAAALNLMCDNARKFNEDGSPLFLAATRMKKTVAKELKKLLTPEDSVTPASANTPSASAARGAAAAAVAAVTAAAVQASPPAPAAAASEPSTRERLDALVAAVKAVTDDDGVLIYEPFVRLPTRKALPAYYDIISDPIDLLTIEKRLEKGEYASTDELAAALNLMCDNARKFNANGSPLFVHATMLKKAVQKELKRQEKIGKVGREKEKADSAPERTEDGDRRRELLNVVKALVDEEGNRLCEPFVKLPTRKALPAYYDVISDPIDLATIEKRLETDDYATVDELAAALNLMCDNARKFNEEGSVLVAHAAKIKKAVQKEMKRFEKPLKLRLSLPDKDKDKDKEAGGEKRERITLKIPVAKHDPLVDDPVKQQMAVYDAIMAHRDSSGRLMHEIFLELPSRSEYPDYYVVITRPIDLTTIHGRITQHQYASLSALNADLELLFANAEKYNEEGSVVHSDAGELRKIARAVIKRIKKKIARANSNSAGPDDSGAVMEVDDDPDETHDKHKDSHPDRKHESQAAGRAGPDSDPQPSGQRALVMLLDFVKNLKDGSGRRRCDAFLRLPSRRDDPAYYLSVSHPMDFATIQQRVRADAYGDPQAFVADVVLWLSNTAIAFIEESTISDDAETALEEFVNKATSVLPRQVVVACPALRLVHTPLFNIAQELVESIRVEVCPESGRQLADLFFTLPDPEELPDYYDMVTRPVSIALILERLYAGAYRRLDALQVDVLQMFRNARIFNEPQSQVYKDSVTLQRLFTANLARIVAEKHISSPNLVLTDESLDQELSNTASDKAARSQAAAGAQKVNDSVLAPEATAASDDKAAEAPMETDAAGGEAQAGDAQPMDVAGTASEAPAAPEPGPATEGLATTADGPPEADTQGVHASDGKQYFPGDYVYVTNPADPDGKPNIIQIASIDRSGPEIIVAGVQFCYPEQTFHLPTTTFYTNEVLRSTEPTSVPASTILRRCYVSFVREYVRALPKDLPEADVFVCENRYTAKSKSMNRIKMWPKQLREPELVARAKPLDARSLPRVRSVFATAPPAAAAAPAKAVELLRPKVLDLALVLHPHTASANEPAGAPDTTLHDGATVNGWTFWVGDAVYVRALGDDPMLLFVERMWTDNAGQTWLAGTWYLLPRETKHPASRLFFDREVLRGSHAESVPLHAVLGPAAIVPVADWSTSRPIALLDDDVFVCESVYNEHDESITKSDAAVQSLAPAARPPSETMVREAGAELRKVLSPLVQLEEKRKQLDASLRKEQQPKTAAAAGRDAVPREGDGSGPVRSEKAKGPSAYVIYTNQQRPLVKAKHPQMSFKDIGHLMRDQWKALPESERRRYQQMADSIAASIKLDETGDKGGNGAVRSAAADAVAAARGKHVVYNCHWTGCGATVGGQEALGEHVMREHIKTTALQCGWVGCAAPAFASRGRLAIHFNETHLASCRQEVAMAATAAIDAAPAPRAPPTAAEVQQALRTGREKAPHAFFSKSYLRFLAATTAPAPTDMAVDGSHQHHLDPTPLQTPKGALPQLPHELASDGEVAAALVSLARQAGTAASRAAGTAGLLHVLHTMQRALERDAAHGEALLAALAQNEA